MATPTLEDLLELLPDNTSGQISAADMRTIVATLWAVGETVEARVSALESASGGTISVTGTWQVNPTPGATPQARQVTISDADVTASTWMRFDPVDQAGNDLTAALTQATKIYGQQVTDSDVWARSVVTGEAVEAGTYIEVPIKFESSSGMGIDPLSWQNALFVFTVPVAAE